MIAVARLFLDVGATCSLYSKKNNFFERICLDYAAFFANEVAFSDKYTAVTTDRLLGVAYFHRAATFRASQAWCSFWRSFLFQSVGHNKLLNRRTCLPKGLFERACRLKSVIAFQF